MTDTSDEKTIVIGRKLRKATQSVDWLEPFPYLGDFDNIIVDTTTLDGDTLGKLFSEEGGEEKLEKCAKEIYEALLSGNVTVFCINSPSIEIGGYIGHDDNSPRPNFSNYHWFPCDLHFEKAQGTQMKHSSDFKPEYVETIKKYDCYLTNVDLHRSSPKYFSNLRDELHTLSTNLVGKPILFGLVFVEYRDRPNYTYRRYENKSLYSKTSAPAIFLPKPTTISVEEGIKRLITSLADPDDVEEPPEWFDDVAIANEQELRKQAEDIGARMIELDSGKKEVVEKIKDISKFKRLLSSTGKPLERIVHEAFELLGFKVERVDGFEQDRNIVFDDFTIPLEIKGRDGALHEGDVLQVIKRSSKEAFEAKRDGNYGILYGNPYRKAVPLSKDRQPTFEPSLIQKAESLGVGLLASEELYKLIERKLNGEKLDFEEVSQKMRLTRGVINF